LVFACLGETARATQIISALNAQLAERKYIDPFLMASIEGGLARRDQMFSSLELAAREHSPLITELDASPWFDAYHDDARYQALVRRIGFPHYKLH
jgi:hypothetical protein